MANFKLNSNKSSEEQLALLRAIQDSQNSILDKLSSLDKRITNVEQAQRNVSFHCSASDLRSHIDKKATDISNAISNIQLEPETDSPPDDFVDKGDSTQNSQ